MDAIAEWQAAYGRVRQLVVGLDERAVDLRVPACPGWTVRELLAHMIGLDADVIAGNEPSDHNSEWTQRQVAERTSRSLKELLAEWDALADDLVAWMKANDTRPLGDVTIHEQDIRGALGAPGAQDTDAAHAIRDRMVDGFGAQLTDQPPIALVGPTWQWVSAGASADASTVLEAPDFDLARAVTTRRSARQLRSWTTRGDVEPYLGAFARLGPLPEHDLTE